MIEALISKELARANTIHRDYFASAHEGKSVIEEEVEEANEAMEMVARRLDHLWTAVKGDDVRGQMQSIQQIRKYAKYAAMELIQVCAMCDKFVASEGEDHE